MDFYLNQVLNAFSSMDAKELGELLNPDYTYQEVPLDTFLEKLEAVFRKLKKGGDTHLEILPGHCCELSCNPELIRTAYRFVGNQTRNYLNFRFITEPTDDGKDHIIKDIFVCYALRCHEGKDWYGEKFSLEVYEDEKPGLHPSPEEIIYTEKALQAVSELMEDKEMLLVEEVEAWLMKYQPTFDFILECDNLYLFEAKWSGFFHLYETLMSYLTFLKKWHSSTLVIASIEEIDMDEDSTKEIILEAERILEEGGLAFLLSQVIELNSFQPFSNYPSLKGKLVENFLRTWVWFRSRQKELVKKYYALTESETDEFLENDDYSDPQSTLKLLSFHLDIRNMAKERGEYIPLGMRA